MQEPALVLLSRSSCAAPFLEAGMEPVGGIYDSIPLHPDDRHPGFDEFKQKKKRIPRPEEHSEGSDGKHPDPDHQVDDYA
jgi:hypothetical protein